MIKVSFLNLKPGTTKSTSAVFTAAAFHAMGLRTLLVDADRGESSSSWCEEADGFPFQVLSMHRKTIGRELPGFLAEIQPDALVIDTPQMEDHEVIARGAMSVTDTWIIPVAPAGIEVDRTAAIAPHMDAVDVIRATPAERLVFMTRTNYRRQTKRGADTLTRRRFEDAGFPVFVDQVPIKWKDDLFRASYGYLPETAGTPYETLARYLVSGLPLAEFAAAYLEEVKAERLAKVYS